MEVPTYNEQNIGQNIGALSDTFPIFSEREYDLAQTQIQKRAERSREAARFVHAETIEDLPSEKSPEVDQPATKKRWSITRVLLAACPEFGESVVRFA